MACREWCSWSLVLLLLRQFLEVEGVAREGRGWRCGMHVAIGQEGELGMLEC